MCGILGWWQPGIGLEGLQTALRAGLAELASRGPDGEGLWIDAEAGLGLGHARLAIRALADGAQPLVSPDGMLRCVVNGELYGSEALRRRLSAQGYRFLTQSDSELALALYAELGLDFVQALEGEFALLLWDARQRRLVAVRDRFGIKPLCYARGPQGLMLASKARALLAMGHPARWDGEALQQSLALQYLLPQQSLIRGSRQLPPGHLLVANADGDLSIQAYWDLDYPKADEPAGHDFEAARAALANGLRQAVRERLAAEVPICGHLSGGIDSSVVLALMAQQSQDLTAFSVSFPEAPAYDELELAKATAGHWGLRHEIVSVRSHDLVRAFADSVRLGEGLSINGHSTAKFLLNQAIRAAGCRVALTGEGADELLLGYAHFRQDLGLAPNNPLVAGLHTSSNSEALDLAPIAAGLGFVPAWLRAKAEQGARLQSLLQPGLQAYPAAEALMGSIDQAQLAGRHRVHQSAWLWIKLALGNYILPTVGDGAEMAHGIEGRPPFLDHRLFEALRGLPPEAHFAGGLEKALLREAFAAELIPALRTRPKHPFLAPPLTAQAPWRQFLHESFSSLPAPPFVDSAAVLKLLKTLPSLSESGHRAWDPVLTTLLGALWLQAGLRLAQP